jgi:hypothetical protein
VRYHCASFMHSISTLSRAEVEIMLAGLRAYGCKRIIVVTMVSDWLRSCTYIHNDQKFEISYNGEDKVTVEYLLGGMCEVCG